MLETISNHISKRHILMPFVGIIVFLLLLTSVASGSLNAYITNSASNTVSVIDTESNTVVHTINVGLKPTGVAAAMNSYKVYVTNSKSNTVSIIDTKNNNVIKSVDVGQDPMGIAVNPAETMVYVANSLSNSVSVINTKTQSVVTTVPIGSSPYGVVVSPDGKKVYVTSSGYIKIIDTKTNTVSSTVNLYSVLSKYQVTGVNSYGITINGNTIYVGAHLTNDVGSWTTIVSIDASTYEFKDYDRASDAHNLLELNGFVISGRTLYTATAFSDLTPQSLWGYDVVDKYITSKDYLIGSNPTGMDTTDDGKIIYVANTGDNTVSVIDTVKQTVKTVNVGLRPVAFGKFLCYSPDNQVIITITPDADFSGSSRKGMPPLNVSFTDQSMYNPTSWHWDFGEKVLVKKDNLPTLVELTSTQQNPIATYYTVGNYTVTLTATNAAGSNKETKSKYVVVSLKPIADFTMNANAGFAPLTVYFTDTSLCLPTSWFWSFGDGKFSTQENPMHKYNFAGDYTVSLTVKNKYGNDTKENFISVQKKLGVNDCKLDGTSCSLQ